MPDPHNNTVLILDSSEKDYNPTELWGRWLSPAPSIRCPACRGEGCLQRHGSYFKYHFLERIRIVRVRCRNCRRTHAMIPSFSLPGLSVGSGEVERFLSARESGKSRVTAAAELRARGVSEHYPKRLERMFVIAIARAKASLPAPYTKPLQGLAWIRSVLGGVDEPLVELNRFGLAHGINGICFCRASILLFTAHSRRRGVSHKKGSARGRTLRIASRP